MQFKTFLIKNNHFGYTSACINGLVLYIFVQAKPLLHRGIEATEELLDPRLKCTRKNSASMERMIRAAAACVINEESRRPGMKEILSILKGGEGIELRTL